MRFDKQTSFSDKQAVTATALSTNVLDLGAGSSYAFTTDTLGMTPIDDISRSPNVDLLITVAQTFTAAGAATLVITLEADDAVAIDSSETLWTSPTIPVASLVAGYQVPVPLEVLKNRTAANRYLALRYTVATGPMTAGKLTAEFVTKTGRQTAPATMS